MVINDCQEVYGDARLSSAQPASHNKIICWLIMQNGGLCLVRRGRFAHDLLLKCYNFAFHINKIERVAMNSAPLWFSAVIMGLKEAPPPPPHPLPTSWWRGLEISGLRQDACHEALALCLVCPCHVQNHSTMTNMSIFTFFFF